MDRFHEIDLFVHIAEASSISRAADQLDLPVSSASRQLSMLEKRLGVRLVQRTTRSLALTEVGMEFYRRCKDILSDLQEAEAVAKDSVDNPHGTLRVTASLSFCLLHIEPLLSEFYKRYPDINVDVIADNQYLNVVENSVDLAIRTREFEADNNLTVRKLAVTKRVLAASQAYLGTYGTPVSPTDLANHKMLIYSYANNPNELPFEKDGKSLIVPVTPALRTNDGQIAIKAALHGMGIIAQPKYTIYNYLESGELVTLLNDWQLPRLTMNIAYQTRRYLPTKVRVFIDTLTEHFSKNNFEQRWN
ncbi:LysR family transcriptional regulator [Pseudomonas agarici]|uniref:LysR family transcriptional regulator n=1 Tax=Pseudomonas agarici TaxID=46677 RepID=A0A0X1T7Y8_PSEAA|nr:LysR family transcriptional regulator [Pseudomonas agarici]AMB88062.1 LysR family transcriptional regulator [Pseudomonas agarici]NWB92948.1 LysR family transcriptional regulator [Pseudomonas agarici]NWC09215.1 LysR family transcriptional regulator [Pseudomonas agarici]SEK31482.1 transcriptional regulator, LysR family [Pseudomonas agarici]